MRYEKSLATGDDFAITLMFSIVKKIKSLLQSHFLRNEKFVCYGRMEYEYILKQLNNLSIFSFFCFRSHFINYKPSVSFRAYMQYSKGRLCHVEISGKLSVYPTDVCKVDLRIALGYTLKSWAVFFLPSSWVNCNNPVFGLVCSSWV